LFLFLVSDSFVHPHQIIEPRIIAIVRFFCGAIEHGVANPLGVFALFLRRD